MYRRADGMSCLLENLAFSYEQKGFPYLNGEGLAHAFADEISLELGFAIKWQKGVDGGGKGIVDGGGSVCGEGGLSM